jgi:hypothetical protein
MFSTLQQLKDEINSNKYLWDYIKGLQTKQSIQDKEIQQAIEGHRYVNERFNNISYRLTSVNVRLDSCCGIKSGMVIDGKEEMQEGESLRSYPR